MPRVDSQCKFDGAQLLYVFARTNRANLRPLYPVFVSLVLHGRGTIFLIEGTSVDNFLNSERAENIPKPDIVSVESTTLLNRRPRLMHIKAQ